MMVRVKIKLLGVFTSILIVLGSGVAQGNHIGDPLYSEEEVFQFWLKKEDTYKRRYPDRDKHITWVGKFSKNEKTAFLAYMDTQEKIFSITPKSVVAKVDLSSGSGKSSYVTSLIVKHPQQSYFGEVVCLVEKKNGQYTIIPLSKPLHLDMGLQLKFHFVDIDGDGLKKIIEDRLLQEDPENPSHDAYVGVIYKNNKMGFREIYRQKNYDFLKLVDLDDDGHLEILETVNELPYETYQPGEYNGLGNPNKIMR